MDINELIAKKEAIASDTSISAEERKKQLRRLRKQIRGAGGGASPTGEPRSPREPKARASRVAHGEQISYEDLLVKTQEHLTNSGLKEFDCRPLEGQPGNSGYGFPIAVSAKAGVTDPQAFLEKFKARWGKLPDEFSYIVLPHETILLLRITPGQPT
jgi:hypothetical protein